MELGNVEESIKSCLQSFIYDMPRGEICCHLGYLFFQKNEYQKSIYWYNLALEGERPESSPFIREDCYTWLPHIQLCLCYDRIQEYKKAYYHNEEAAKFIPNHSSVIHNREYFRNFFKE